MIPSLLAGLASPGLTHVLYAVAGAALAWWAKQHPTPTLADVWTLLPPSLVGPVKALVARAESDPTVGGVVKLVIDRAEQAAVLAAHDVLQSLATPAAVPSIAVTTAPAK